MLIPGVYIKGNDLAGIVNGKIKALLETSMINWSALLVPYHDKVNLTSPGHLPGNSSKVRRPSVDLRDPRGEASLRPGTRPHILSLGPKSSSPSSVSSSSSLAEPLGH